MMHSLKRTPLAAGILLALSNPLYSPPALAAPGDPFGNEFQVNTFTSGSQNLPSVGMDADGDFVIAWQSLGQDGDSDGIYAQRYQADGSMAGGEFLVNTETNSGQSRPSIALDADGDFVITWMSNDQDSYGIYAQRYQADGTAAGSEFQVNTFTSGSQNSPSIALDADGDFVIAWQSLGQDGDRYGIYAQRYQADGSAAGSEFQVNTETNNGQAGPNIAMDTDGDFVITWASSGQDGDSSGIYAQRYQADGSAAGSEFQVNTETVSSQRLPSIALDADGDFVIAWESYLQDGSFSGIFAQRYQADGSAAGGEFQVNTQTQSFQMNPSIAMDADGYFAIAWQTHTLTNDVFDVHVQRYQADGTAIESEFLVNTETFDRQSSPSIAMDSDGDFVTAWASFNQDGSVYGIYAQRYEGAGSSGVNLNLVLQDDTDPVTVGDSFVYSLIITNNGTETATDLSLSDPIPTGLTYVSDDAATVDWSCALSGNTINCDKASMSVGEMNTINLTVTADTIGTVSNTVTVSATQTDLDNTDNTDTETTTVIDAVTDTTAPLITLLGDNPISVTQNTVFTDPGVAITDNVDTGLVATVTGSVDTATAGTYTLRYNATDDAGNAAIEVQRTVIVVDAISPVIALLGDNPISVAQNSAFSDPGATVTDNVDAGLAATVTGSVDTATLGSYTLRYNVTDNAGNVAIEVQRTVIVVDAISPVITLLGDNPISVTQNTVFADPGVSVTDNVDTGLAATVTGSVDTATPGSYLLRYNVSDTAGNAAIEVQRTVIVESTVIVVDAISPVITLLGDSPISVTQNTVFTDPGVTITDNVDMGLVATVTGSVDTATTGSYTLRYNVTDNAGNAAIEVQRTVIVESTVIAVDAISPVITLLGDNPISVTQNTVFTDPGVTVTDNVDVGLVATASGSVDTATAGSYTLSYNVTDIAGNAAIEVQRTVTVIAAPVVTTSSGRGAFGITSLLLAVPLWFRRRKQG